MMSGMRQQCAAHYASRVSTNKAPRELKNEENASSKQMQSVAK